MQNSIDRVDTVELAEKRNPYAFFLAWATCILVVLGLVYAVWLAVASGRLGAVIEAGPVFLLSILTGLSWATVKAVVWSIDHVSERRAH